MKKIICIILILLGIYTCPFAQTKEPVYVIPVKGVIDLGLSNFIRRSLNEAKESNAKAIILEIDTFGGRVDAAVEITDALEKIKPIQTIAFIDDQAWSAGALISLACDKIIMSAGSSIGSAEPRAMGPAGSEEITDEKTVSAIRAKFKAQAEENNHPVNLALAMVDKDFEIIQVKIKEEIKIITGQELEELKQKLNIKEIQILKTINPKGKLINLTAKEAKEYGLSEELLNNRLEVIKYIGLDGKGIIETKTTWSEILVRFLTHPMVSPLLLTLGFLGLLFEFKIPGWGASGTIGVILLALFFWGHYLVGLANWTEIIIFVIGILLLAIEIFVIPGFGITGALGITFMLGGVFLALIKHPLQIPKIELVQAIYSLAYAIIGTTLAILLLIRFLPKSSAWKNIILNAQEKKEQGFHSATLLDSYLDKTGKTLTILRPAGRAVFAGKILDVITQGGFVEKDKDIKVISVQGGKLVVEETKDA